MQVLGQVSIGKPPKTKYLHTTTRCAKHMRRSSKWWIKRRTNISAGTSIGRTRHGIRSLHRQRLWMSRRDGDSCHHLRHLHTLLHRPQKARRRMAMSIWPMHQLHCRRLKKQTHGQALLQNPTSSFDRCLARGRGKIHRSSHRHLSGKPRPLAGFARVVEASCIWKPESNASPISVAR